VARDVRGRESAAGRDDARQDSARRDSAHRDSARGRNGTRRGSARGRESGRQSGRAGRSARRSPGLGRWGTLQGGLGVCIIVSSAAVGTIATMVTRNPPGLLLAVFVIAGTVAAALAVRPSAGRTIVPVPALAYVMAALISGVVFDRSTATSKAALAIGAAQWIADGFFAMVLATVLALVITVARWLLWRRSRPAVRDRDRDWAVPAATPVRSSRSEVTPVGAAAPVGAMAPASTGPAAVTQAVSPPRAPGGVPGPGAVPGTPETQGTALRPAGGPPGPPGPGAAPGRGTAPGPGGAPRAGGGGGRPPGGQGTAGRRGPAGNSGPGNSGPQNSGSGSNGAGSNGNGTWNEPDPRAGGPSGPRPRPRPGSNPYLSSPYSFSRGA
jgi:Domain of unknown function (DUF6542)